MYRDSVSLWLHTFGANYIQGHVSCPFMIFCAWMNGKGATFPSDTPYCILDVFSYSAFKAHHSGTTFFFAAERLDDMGK